MFVELFGLMVGLDREWSAQGATDDELNLVAFDWDYVPVVQCGGVTGLFGGTQPITLEETEDSWYSGMDSVGEQNSSRMSLPSPPVGVSGP